MQPRLGVIGDVVEDIVVWLEEPLRYASDTRVTIHRSRGGSAANVAALAAASISTVFLGRIGSDAIGAALVRRLTDAGVDVRVQRAGMTGTIVVLVDADGERTMLPDRAAALDFSDVDPAWTSDLTHVHIPAYSLVDSPLRRSALAIAAGVTSRGGTLSIDASSTSLIEELGARPLLHTIHDLGTTYVFANHSEAEALELFGGGRSLVPHATVIAKDGPRPTTILEPGREPWTVPVPRVPAVRDLTGAGDAFAAGFLATVCADGSMRDAVVAGHASAARVLAHAGAESATCQSG